MSDTDDYSLLNIRTIHDQNSLETKKLVNIGLGEASIVNMNIPAGSASPLSFLKQKVLHELKRREPQLNILPVDTKIRALYCGFTNDTISLIWKIFVRTKSNGWISEEIQFVITTGHKRNVLVNDNLSQIGTEIAKKQPLFPVNNVSFPDS